MTKIRTDYTKLEFIGIQKRGGAVLSRPGELVYLFREKPYGPKEVSILSILRPEEVSVPESQFNGQMKELEGRIREIEESWEYRKVINFDSIELDELRQRYEVMQRLKEEIDTSFNPYKTI